MIKNPLQNVETLETVGVVLVGIVLLFTLEPVSAVQRLLADILTALLVVLVVFSLWQTRHHRRS